ncbi:MAG: MFS transporter [Proteobacteria bacterium]|nr:MFS transporter [Pseudomonadota bacterium]
MARVVRLYIAFQFFFNLLLWVPIFYTFQRQMGLSDPQIFGIQSIYYVAFCLFEIPTGYIADRFGYRCSMLLGAAMLTAANVLPIIHAGYTSFLYHFLAIALARSLISGASSAYLYEFLKAENASDIYKKVEADARFYSLIGRIAAWAAVGWLMAWQVTSPYWISAINAGLSLVIAIFMPSVSIPVMTSKRSLRAWASCLNSQLALLMLQGVGIFVMVRVLQVNLYQPILTAKSFDVTAFGWSMSLMTVFEAVGAKVAPYLRRRFTDLTVVTLATITLSVALTIVAASGQTGTLAAFCLFSLAAGVAFPVQKQLLNDAITDSHQRATLLSLESILDRALCALAVLPLGGLVAQGHLSLVLCVTGAAAAVAVLMIQVGYRSLRQ